MPARFLLWQILKNKEITFQSKRKKGLTENRIKTEKTFNLWKTGTMVYFVADTIFKQICN
jgi:hypothetical protein